MAEYIEKNKAIKELYEVYDYEFPTASGGFDEYARMIVPNTIKNMPAADVAPVVHAHWQPYADTVQCSACGFGTFMDGYFFVHGECTHADDRSFRFSFCPNCGAKMDEKED